MRSLSGRFQALRRASGQRGAAAVEFALISVIFFPLLFAVLDYGMWFNDSLNARQGVREGARLGVVQEFGTCTKTNKLECLQQIVKDEIRPAAGVASVRIVAPDGWKKREPLIVCAAVKESGIFGMVPLPNDRVITSETRMSIEVDVPATVGNLTVSDTYPAGGGSWAWCG
jgi:hypothetical protein